MRWAMITNVTAIWLIHIRKKIEFVSKIYTDTNSFNHHLSGLVQWYGYLALTQETGVRFPDSELFTFAWDSFGMKILHSMVPTSMTNPGEKQILRYTSVRGCPQLGSLQANRGWLELAATWIEADGCVYRRVYLFQSWLACWHLDCLAYITALPLKMNEVSFN